MMIKVPKSISVLKRLTLSSLIVLLLILNAVSTRSYYLGWIIGFDNFRLSCQ